MGTPNKKQTAVEWLFEQIPFEWSSSRAAFDALQQAKEMEKEQIMNARQDGHDSTYIGCESGCGAQYHIDESNETYYKETYGE